MNNIMDKFPHERVEQNCAPEIWIDGILPVCSLQQTIITANKSLSTVSIVLVLGEDSELVLMFSLNQLWKEEKNVYQGTSGGT